MSLIDEGIKIDEWIKKTYVLIHIYLFIMEYYAAIKKDWNLAICNNMDGPREHYAK